MRKRFANGHEFRVAAVYIAAGGLETRIQILAVGATKGADAIRRVNPRHADTLADAKGTGAATQRCDAPDDLVAEDGLRAGAAACAPRSRRDRCDTRRRRLRE